MCENIFENCTKPKPVSVSASEIIPQKRTIGISDAGCSYVTCQKNCYNGDYGITRPTIIKKSKGCR